MKLRFVAVIALVGLWIGCGSQPQSSQCATLVACCNAIGSKISTVQTICSSSAVTTATPSGSCWSTSVTAAACTTECTQDLTTMKPLVAAAQAIPDAGAVDASACAFQ